METISFTQHNHPRGTHCSPFLQVRDPGPGLERQVWLVPSSLSPCMTKHCHQAGGRPSLEQCAEPGAACLYVPDNGTKVKAVLCRGGIEPGKWQPLTQLLTVTEGPSGHKWANETHD